MEENAQASASTQAPDSKPVYELGFHVAPTVLDEGVAPVVEKVRAALSTIDAELIKETFPAKMTLAYTIEISNQGKRTKYTESYFGAIKFAIEKEHVNTLSEALRGTKEILRYLIVETVREDVVAPRRAIFTSDRLEGETIAKPAVTEEKKGPVSEEELDKSIDALVS